MILAQSNPLAGVLTDCYTVPVGKEAVISTISICNRDPAQTNCRLSIARSGAADSPEQYLLYGLPIPGNDAFDKTEGYCLNAGDVVRVWALAATLSFNVTGIERNPI